MGNEKNFLFAILLTVIILLAYPLIAQKMFPQYFNDQTPTQLKQEEPISATDPIRIRSGGAIISGQTQAEVITEERIYTIENERLIVNISQEMADIRSLRVKTFYNPATGLPEELAQASPFQRGVFNTNALTNHVHLEQAIPGSTSVQFIYKIDDVTIDKKISLANEGYGVVCEITIRNEGDNHVSFGYDIIAAQHFSSAGGIDERFNEAVIMFSDRKLHKKNIGGIQKETYIKGEPHFAGIKTRYFSTILVPDFITQQAYYSGIKQEKTRDTTVGIQTHETPINPRQEITHRYLLYTGPNIHEEMVVFRADIEYVRGKGIMAGLAELLLLLLRFLYRIFNNYGMAVIGLAFITNLALYPLTLKSLSSMKEMQHLQPLVEKLRKEYKDNPQKLNKEIMELYKKHKVNPAGGCLPMIMQMPVFFALYGVLMSAIELRGATFLWIKDLSSPDAMITFSSAYPFIGNSLNILPLIMVVVSFVQQKTLTPGQGNEQQKAMATIMPVMLGFIFYNFPSGLVLYFLTNSIFSFIVQLRIKTVQPAGAS